MRASAAVALVALLIGFAGGYLARGDGEASPTPLARATLGVYPVVCNRDNSRCWQGGTEVQRVTEYSAKDPCGPVDGYQWVSPSIFLYDGLQALRDMFSNVYVCLDQRESNG